MKINSIPPKDLFYQYVHVREKSVETPAKTQGTDKVELTEAAKTFSAALKAAKEAVNRSPSDIKKIDQIRQQIQANTYSVTGSQVAEKLLK